MDRENVIRAVDSCFDYWLDKNRWLHQPQLEYVRQIKADALAMLKEQDKRWIPVTERLPRSIANKVLVYVQHEDYVGYIGYGHYEKYKGQEMWFDLEHNEEFSKRGYHVTHWMETPMPPMEGR